MRPGTSSRDTHVLGSCVGRPDALVVLVSVRISNPNGLRTESALLLPHTSFRTDLVEEDERSVAVPRVGVEDRVLSFRLDTARSQFLEETSEGAAALRNQSLSAPAFRSSSSTNALTGPPFSLVGETKS